MRVNGVYYYRMKHKEWILTAVFALLMTACTERQHQFETEVMLPYTPVKSQGGTQLCWAYAMLSAIETEHICRGDSVELSVPYVAKMLEREPDAPPSGRAMAATALNLMAKYGAVPLHSMPAADYPVPEHAYLLGCEYTPLEFAHSVCAPGEWAALTTTDDGHPYYEEVELALPDNWEHNRFINLPADSLLALTERAVRQHHGICWEGDTSEWGYDWQQGVAVTSLWNGRTTDDHCMAIVGIAHDEEGARYFVMKNSWGTANRYEGLMYVSFDYFVRKTIAVYLPANLL